MDKLETNVSKATREGVNEANKIELKRQRTEEKIKQDEQKIDNSKENNLLKIVKSLKNSKRSIGREGRENKKNEAKY